MTDSDGYDTTEKVERTDVGYRLTVESTRGTGTRDQDKVKVEARTQTLSGLLEKSDVLTSEVTHQMNRLRAHQPDEDGEDGD